MIASLKHNKLSLRLSTLKKYVLPLRGEACTKTGAVSAVAIINTGVADCGAAAPVFDC
jgi:hypothetical protein